MRKSLLKITGMGILFCFCINLAFLLPPGWMVEAIGEEIIIDNGQSGYYETGEWRDSGLKGYNNSQSRYSKTQGSTAVWKAELILGKYNVYVYKIVSENCSKVQSYDIIYKDATKNVIIDFTVGESGWTLLGEYDFAGGGEECVKLTGKQEEYNRADAVKFEPIKASEEAAPKPSSQPIPTPTTNEGSSVDGIVIDNGSKGYHEEGTWLDSGLRGYKNSISRYANAEGAAAIWKPELEKDRYKVYIYKLVAQNSSKAQYYEIVSSGKTEIKELDLTTGMKGWFLLGEFDFDGKGEEYVKTICKKDEYARADAVKFVIVEQDPTLLDLNAVLVRINGKLQTYDQPALIQNGRTLVPLRGIFEALDAQVEWDEKSSTVTAQKGDIRISLTIGKNEAYKNNTQITLDQPPVLINERTMVPVRFVSESLGASVGWLESKRTVEIYMMTQKDGLAEIAYPLDSSNRAGWWSPITVYGGGVYMAFNGRGEGEETHRIQLIKKEASGVWSLLNCYEDSNQTVLEYPYDPGHRQSSIAIDGSGRIHLFGSMHTSPWNYYRNSGKDDDLINFSSEMADNHTTFTYPVAKTAPNGDVYLIARVDEFLKTDQKREGKLYRWDNANETWSCVGAFAGETNRAIYPNDIQIDAEGNVHILYEWSVFPSSAMRHKLSYIKYVPSTGKWYDYTGQDLKIPADTSSSNIIQDMVTDEAWMGDNDNYTGPAVQSAKMDVDASGTVRIVYRHRDLKDGFYKVKLASFSQKQTLYSEEIYSDSHTNASLDITSTGGQIGVYYSKKTDTGSEAWVAYKNGAGTYERELLAPGKVITHISVISDGKSDHIYLVEFENDKAKLYYKTR